MSGYLLQTVASFLFTLICIVLIHVTLHIVRPCAGVVALFANKRFFTSVGELMTLKLTSFSTLVIALLATEGLLPTVDEHVLLEATSKGAGITALVTAEWLL